MKVGDAVKLRSNAKMNTNNRVGIVVAKQHYTMPDGNPNGDFTRHIKWKVLFGNEVMVIKNRHYLEVINESR